MATYQPPKRGVEYIFYVGLVSQADPKLLKANPTLAAGDVQISKDGGAFANLTTLPAVTPAGGKAVKVTVSATEMTSDNATIVFSDAAGAEWCDLIINIATSAQQVDDLATQTSVNTIDDFLDTEIAAILAAVDTEIGDIQARLPAALVGGRIDASVGAAAANTLTASALATDAAQEIADTVIGRTLTESYAADGAAPTLQQALLLVQQMLTEKSISGVTMTVKKIDGATTAAIFTLNDAVTPTSITRAT